MARKKPNPVKRERQKAAKTCQARHFDGKPDMGKKYAYTGRRTRTAPMVTPDKGDSEVGPVTTVETRVCRKTLRATPARLRHGCHFELVFKPKPHLRLCSKLNEKGWMIPVKNPEHAQVVAKQVCDCTRKAGKQHDAATLQTCAAKTGSAPKKPMLGVALSPVAPQGLAGLDTVVASEPVKKPKRRSGPPSAKQLAQRQRFKAAAAACKGQGQYRACIARRMKEM